MKKSYAVLGLGLYGKTVVHELLKRGADVLAVDVNEQIVENEKSNIPLCKCADVTNVEALKMLGISNIDTVIISMASHLEESVMATMLCKELGVSQVIVKCSTEFNKKILLKVGADRVVIPENESGVRLAKAILNYGFLDMVDISDKVSMAELEMREEWVGKSLIELNLRAKYSINVVAIKKGMDVITSIDPAAPLEKDMVLLVIADVEKLGKLGRQ
jgi:trk system potassium uptake protein TrkA